MSTLSIKRRVVAVATLAAGLQGGVLAPSMAVDTVADPTPSLHDIAGVGDLDDPLMQRRDGETNVDLDDPNDGDITLTIHHEKGTALLIWSGLPAELSAESMLADVALCTSTDKCTHRSVSLAEGGSPGEVALLVDVPAEGTFYVITLTDATYGITHVDFLMREHDTLVEAPANLRSHAQPGITPPHGDARPTVMAHRRRALRRRQILHRVSRRQAPLSLPHRNLALRMSLLWRPPLLTRW